MNMASMSVDRVLGQRRTCHRCGMMRTGFRSLAVAVVVAVAAAPAAPVPAWGQTVDDFNKLSDQCWELMHAGKYGEAEQLAERLYHWAQGPLIDQALALAVSCHTLGTTYGNQYRYREAEPLHKQALEICRKVLGNEHPDVARSLNSLANSYENQGRYAEAEPLYKQALEILRKARGNEHPDVARSLNNLAILYENQGRYAEAEPLYKQALEIFRKFRDKGHPDLALGLSNLANLYYRQGRYREAEPLHKQALEVSREVLGDEHPDVAKSLNNLAALYWNQGRYAEAEPLQKQALEIRRAVLGVEHPDLAESLNNLAILYNDQGRCVEAEPLHKQALEIRRAALGAEHPDLAESLNNLAILYNEQGRYAEAESLLDEAQEIAQHGTCSPMHVARIQQNLAEVYWQTDRRTEAAATLEEALLALEQQRTQVWGAELERARFFSGWTHLFEQMVSWRNELRQPAEAFLAIERSRARSLSDQMQTAGMDLLAGLPEQEAKRLREQESQAAGRVAVTRKQLDVARTRHDLSPEREEKEQQRLLAELQQAQFEYTQAYAEIRSASQVYRLAISNDQKPGSAGKLGQWVRGREALLLEYFLGDKGGYVFVLPYGQQPQLHKLGVTDEQAAALGVEPGALTAERMRAILANEQETGVLQHLRASHDPRRAERAVAALAVLWEVLIPDPERKTIVEGKYERLIVLPDASLAQLPFETLVVEPGQDPKYLLDVGPPMIYAPSATILLNLAEREDQVLHAADQPVLAVGDCIYGEPVEASDDTQLAQLAPSTRYGSLGEQPDRLKYSGWEISFVAQVFGKRGIQVASLKGESATEQNLRRNLPGRRIVDLACHGRVDQEYGNLFGALALTPGPDPADAANDGFLTLAETYELDLAGCELAILSACDTNVGPEQRGEGVWALSRGFLAAGARRVAATNWLLDDEAAASTVSYFCAVAARHEAFGGEVDYAQALHEAKRWVRSKENWRRPYFWAPMVLIGPQ